MGFWEVLLLAVSLSADAFAVSVCKGLSVKRATLGQGVICGCWFGGFQALMPAIGFLLASLFAQAISDFDHWIAFGLLAIIGINMLKETFEKEECECCSQNDFAVKTMFVMAIATSIDALAAGIALKMDDGDPFIAIPLIGVTTFCFSAVGVKIGNVFGARFEKKAQFAGGVILVLLGLKILLEHLHVFA